MKKLILLVLIVIGWFGACPISGPRDVMDIEVVVIDTKAPRHPFQSEYEQMLYPTVRITTLSGTGSGVIFHRKDAEDAENTIYILTAAHVVDNQTIVNIELYNSTVITGTVVITDAVKDLALLKPTGLISYQAQLAPRNYTPYLFTPVWAVGCSLGLPPRPSYGHLCAFAVNNWEISAPILPGNSGGPVYVCPEPRFGNVRTYEVIGIAVWVKVYQFQLVTTMAGIVPINQIHQFLDSHRKGAENAEKK